ncbi:Zinc homeostasis factor 1 [Fulvia fulva]|uniref:Zinc homeostasis factor 1 n=1 Tax=Passalora fulva TaxID=5499 RepID=A0A9Q8LC22_PASFU|nr:Zinc homeostasis factor 1 [Fulvia fulva]KAK4629028.1 Zinc homeostasis factor 1 [Fulvia fulva]KAK4630376.1 Zinc homeostasis factor 1 [Fulvia fulva]UJO14720.1 Zinc homeostasis factor 1 [Fulvia fulva]WPV12174.1 Zinc homeostasis factor 1 [Fulvia fulva]WPV27533.1 Zinc homeostasis factor 1 [Fulvia fulva]
MALSKSTRIIILLVIDSAFFLLELITGYAVHSLALVADSFHMLNDVLSLCVGLWAVKMANKTSAPKMYTYGYQRAETLGALVNGVFLVALCVTIFLDAIQRFVEPQIVSNPKLVLIVGCLGLASNIVGLALFHDHGHAHGGHSHGPEAGHSHDARDAEEGHAGHVHEPYTDEPHDHSHGEAGTDASGSTAVADVSPRKRGHSKAGSKGFINYDEYPGPAAFRNSIIAASNMEPIDSDEGEPEIVPDREGVESTSAYEPLMAGTAQKISYGGVSAAPRKSNEHKDHKHSQPREAGKGGGGHSHGDLNMKGIFLHVVGDALGNIGVIATALIIWLTKFEGRYYFDPAISLVITCIILASAIPLCKAASRILLQAVPHGIEVDDIRDDIEDLSGVESCHHLHVWQLSDTKLVASLHVRVTFNFKGEGSQRYMQLAAAIRECLHEYGIHSFTIQPEFHHDSESDDGRGNVENSNDASRSGSMRGMDKSCLLECNDNCGGGKSCCPPEQQNNDNSHDDHGHSH